jgi:hypothetical protein
VGNCNYLEELENSTSHGDTSPQKEIAAVELQAALKSNGNCLGDSERLL